MKKIGIIINPNSRINKKTKCASVSKFTKIAGNLADIRTTKSLDELKQAIKEFKKNKYDYVVISGGDGTIHHVVSALISEYKENVPPILLLKDGTMNNIATSIKLEKSSTDALKALIHLIQVKKNIRLVQRDTIKINDKHCFLFGFGLTTNFLNEVYVYDKKGLRQNIRVIGKTIAEAFLTLTNISEDKLSLFKPLEYEIKVDGKAIPFSKVLCLIAGTVETIGMGFSTLYRANDIPNTFHVIINGMKPIQLVRELQKLLLGEEIENCLNYDAVCNLMEIKAKEPFDYTMDGDIYLCDSTLSVKTGVPLKFILL